MGRKRKKERSFEGLGGRLRQSSSTATALRILCGKETKGRNLRKRTKKKPARTERLRRLYVADEMERKQEKSTLADRRDDILFNFAKLFGGRLVRLFDGGKKRFAFGSG